MLGLAGAAHAEYDPDASGAVITALSCPLSGKTARIFLNENSMARGIYGEDETEEAFNCSYGLDARCRELFELGGFKTAGVDDAGEVRILELPENRFHIAALFQPQLRSTPGNPHKLILAFLAAAQRFHDERRNSL